MTFCIHVTVRPVNSKAQTMMSRRAGAFLRALNPHKSPQTFTRPCSFDSAPDRTRPSTTHRSLCCPDSHCAHTHTHAQVFANNRAWAASQVFRDPDFFSKLQAGQAPTYLWIGCSDSRIPAEQVAGLRPGEAFVHRNIANLVCHSDLNTGSVIEYAVAHLGVRHIVVCGHYGCGGVRAAMVPRDMGLLNPWLRHIRDVYRLHARELDTLDEDKRYHRLVELNVVEQCRNVVKTAAVQQSWNRNRFPTVHGWVFDFRDGLLKDLDIGFKDMLRDVRKVYDLPGP